jgi:pimeloyl-ACP methyl ester carboxylesterase
MRRPILLFAGFLLLSGCIHWRQDPLTGLDHVSGWSDQVRAAADEAYLYAQMSVNAYDDEDRYDLGPAVRTIENAPNNELGFAYSIFEHRRAGGLEVVIAFRGTEFRTTEDWIDGNLFARQNPQGLALYDRIRARYDPDVPITVTGHSLGGGIAIQVSLERPNVKAYVFNTSPRFRLRGSSQPNRRLSIVEYGEFLKAARLFGREANQTYVSLNCSRGLNSIAQHSSRRLADCLTRIAAYQQPEARASLARNHIPPPVGLPDS